MIRLSVTVSGGRLELDKKVLRQTMRAAGTEVAAVARQLIRRGGTTGPRGGKRASSPSQPPANHSGLLASSFRVTVYKSGEGVSVRDTAFYARFLETGAHGGGGNTKDKANILRAGQLGRSGRVLRGQNRMKSGAVNKTRVLMPRPFLTIALAMREASIAQRVGMSINQGVKFVRMKA